MNYDYKKDIILNDGTTIKAWGYLEYPQKLSKEDVSNYELYSEQQEVKPPLNEMPIEPIFDMELMDDETSEAGTAFFGETVKDFIDSVDSSPSNVGELNELLHQNGIMAVTQEEYDLFTEIEEEIER